MLLLCQIIKCDHLITFEAHLMSLYVFKNLHPSYHYDKNVFCQSQPELACLEIQHLKK